MKTPLMMIINPAAGKGEFKDGLPEALKLLSDAGYAVNVFFTEERGHATRLAYEHGGDYEKLVCLGGDGTLAEVIAGLMQLPKRPQVGYFPIGTANDIARTVGLPKNDMIESASRFVTGEPMPFDVGKRGDGYFNYFAGFGAFTEVSYGTPQDIKKKLGEAAYLIGAVKAVKSLKTRHVKVEYDDGEFDGEFLYGGVSNSYSVGGIVDLPRELVNLSDGEHELILIKKLPGLGALLKLAAQVLIKHDLSSDYIVIRHTKKAKFIFDEPTVFSLDGEESQPYMEFESENCCQAIKIIR